MDERLDQMAQPRIVTRKPPISTSQVEVTVFTQDDAPTQVYISVRESADRVRYILLTAVEMDALVASWQRERARVIVSEGGIAQG
jgi:hypothetical protein